MSRRLTDKQVKEFREIFDLYDEDRSGMISRNELAQMLRSTGLNSTAAEMKAIFQEVDEDGSGNIQFTEFLALMYRHADKANRDDTAYFTAAFRMLDKNGSGYLSLRELRHVLTTCGDAMSNEEVDEVMRLADKNADGKINLNEFLALLRSA